MGAFKGPKTQPISGAAALPVDVTGEAVTPADAAVNASGALEFNDASSNPLPLYVWNGYFNGTTWDRARGDATAGAYVQGNTTVGAAYASTQKPVVTGGVGRTIPPFSVDEQDAVTAWHALSGAYIVASPNQVLDDSNATFGTTAATVQGTGGSSQGYPLAVMNLVFDGTNWIRQRGGTSGQFVQGSVAHDAVYAGNPLPLGGYASAAVPTAVTADGDAVRLWAGLSGNLMVGARAAAGADGTSNNIVFMPDQNAVAKLLGMAQYQYNGTTWDRVRNNLDAATVGITAAGVTTTQTGTDQTNYNARGVTVILDMTNVGTGSVTLSIQGKDAVSGKYFTLLTGAAVVTNSTNVYVVYPGVTVAANAAVSQPLPRTWRVVVTANNANATTYTVAAALSN